MSFVSFHFFYLPDLYISKHSSGLIEYKRDATSPAVSVTYLLEGTQNKPIIINIITIIIIIIIIIVIIILIMVIQHAYFDYSTQVSLHLTSPFFCLSHINKIHYNTYILFSLFKYNIILYVDTSTRICKGDEVSFILQLIPSSDYRRASYVVVSVSKRDKLLQEQVK